MKCLSLTVVKMKVVIISGSEKDLWHIEKIVEKLSSFDISSQVYHASAHKNPTRVLEILSSYKDEKVVCITVAGMSNALSGFVAANSNFITIACPPFKDKLDMMTNIQSTLQMPSDVPVLTVLNPGNCALAVKRIMESLM